MKKMWVIGLLLFTNVTWAQNLVPNGSFEEYTECPPYFGFAMNASGWYNLITQSADYFNACHTEGVVGVPLNQFGYQYPADGDAYMGMATFAYNDPGYREMVGIALTEPLQVGVPICLSFKMAVGGFGTSLGNSAAYTCKGIGMRFFNTLPTQDYMDSYPNSAALYLDEVPTDTAIWYTVEGQYVPDSAYSYVVIGNFFEDSLSAPTLQTTVGEGGSDVSYAFVDDVRASFDLNYCTLSVGILPEQEAVPSAYPVPAASSLQVRLPSLPIQPVQYTVYDLFGKCLLTGTSTLQDATVINVPLEGLPDGSYLVRINASGLHWPPIPFLHLLP